MRTSATGRDSRFVLLMLGGAAWGYTLPEVASRGSPWIPEALAVIMLGMGLTLTKEDLRGLRAGGTGGAGSQAGLCGAGASSPSRSGCRTPGSPWR